MDRKHETKPLLVLPFYAAGVPIAGVPAAPPSSWISSTSQRPSTRSRMAKSDSSCERHPARRALLSPPPCHRVGAGPLPNANDDPFLIFRQRLRGRGEKVEEILARHSSEKIS